MGILGKALSGAATAVQPVALAGLQASIMAERDARLQQYSAGSEQRKQTFESEQKGLDRATQINVAEIAAKSRGRDENREKYRALTEALQSTTAQMKAYMAQPGWDSNPSAVDEVEDLKKRAKSYYSQLDEIIGVSGKAGGNGKEDPLKRGDGAKAPETKPQAPAQQNAAEQPTATESTEPPGLVSKLLSPPSKEGGIGDVMRRETAAKRQQSLDDFSANAKDMDAGSMQRWLSKNQGTLNSEDIARINKQIRQKLGAK